jgi:hypothetical protein
MTSLWPLISALSSLLCWPTTAHPVPALGLHALPSFVLCLLWEHTQLVVLRSGTWVHPTWHSRYRAGLVGGAGRARSVPSLEPAKPTDCYMPTWATAFFFLHLGDQPVPRNTPIGALEGQVTLSGQSVRKGSAFWGWSSLLPVEWTQALWLCLGRHWSAKVHKVRAGTQNSRSRDSQFHRECFHSCLILKSSDGGWGTE